MTSRVGSVVACSLVYFSVVWYGPVCCGVVRCGPVWSSMVRCGSKWCNYLWCGTVLHTMTGRGGGVCAAYHFIQCIQGAWQRGGCGVRGCTSVSYSLYITVHMLHNTEVQCTVIYSLYITVHMLHGRGVVVACEDVNIIASFTLCFLLSASLHTWHPLKSNGFKWNIMDSNGIQ